MLLKAYNGISPQLSPSVRIAENATVVGDVTLGENVSVWYGATLRGDAGAIRIGAGSNLQDGVIVHDASQIPTQVGEHVVVGHGAILHSCTIGDECLIGMGAILLNGSVIGDGSLVAAGAVVTEGKVFPPNSMLMGTPARVVRTITPEERAEIRQDAEGYVLRAQEQLPLWQNEKG
jgi:carbonic anhydrase/acetyltransferase-like protein (isoleucine patch superfamily)